MEDVENQEYNTEDSTVEHTQRNFKDVYNQTAEKVLGYRRMKVKSWILKDSCRQVEERGKPKQEGGGAKSQKIIARKKEKYQLKDIEVKRALGKDKREWVDRIAVKAEE